MTVIPQSAKIHSMTVNVPFSWAFIPPDLNPQQHDPQNDSEHSLSAVPSGIRISNVVGAVIESVKLAQAGPALFTPRAQVSISSDLTEDEYKTANEWMSRGGGVMVMLPERQGKSLWVSDGRHRMWEAYQKAHGCQIPVMLEALWWCAALDSHLDPGFKEMIERFGHTAPQFKEANPELLGRIEYIQTNWSRLKKTIQGQR